MTLSERILEHWNECATCKCFAPWPYFHTSQYETRKLRKRWSSNVFTPWKAAGVLAQDNSPSTTPTTPSSSWDTTLTSVMPNTGPNSTCMYSSTTCSKQFYKRSSAKRSHSLRLREHFSGRYDLTCAQSASEKIVEDREIRGRRKLRHKVFCLADVD